MDLSYIVSTIHNSHFSMENGFVMFSNFLFWYLHDNVAFKFIATGLFTVAYTFYFLDWNR